MTIFIYLPYLILLFGLLLFLPAWKNPKVGQIGWFITRIGLIAVAVALLTGHGSHVPILKLP
jgi:hypothetical protein